MAGVNGIVRRTVGPLTLGPALAWTLGACGGPPSSSPIPSRLTQAPTFTSAVRPLSTTNCRTLDDPRYSGQDELIAIDPHGLALGYDNGSYLTWPPYRPKDYRYIAGYGGARSSMVTGFVGKHVMVGYVTDPPQLKGTWAFIKINSLWTILRSRKGKVKNPVTELLGINRRDVSVGFYVNRNGAAVPFSLGAASEGFTDLHPPGAISAEATSIDDPGAIAGFFTISDGSTRGWLYQRHSYTELSYPGSVNTWFSGIAPGDRIVGSYADSLGATHGLLVTHPTGAPQWQSLDIPNAVAIEGRGINVKGEIVGDYADASGNTHGFLCL